MAGKSVIDVKILGDNKGLSGALGDSEDKIGKFAKFGAAAFVAVGAAAVAIGAGLFKIGSDFDKQFDKIRVGTGATGDALTGLEDSFKNVLKSVPASFDDAGSAIADLNTRLGLTGKPLEDLAGQMINLSRITKTDVATNVDNLTRTFGDWGVATEDQAGTLDKLYRASQASGISITDLSTSLVQSGAPLRNLGFSIDESAALLAGFNKTGVNTDTVIAGLKAGVGKLAKAGEDVPATFSRVVDEITKLGPGTEATAKAIELFGQRAGPDLADAIAGGKFEIGDMLAAITGGTDTINGAAADTADFSEKWLLFKNRVLVGLQPLATKVFDAVGDAMDKLGPIAEKVIAWFSEKLPVAVALVRTEFEKVWPKIRDAVTKALGFIVDNVWPKIKTAFAGIVEGAKRVYDFFNNNRDSLVAVLIAIGAAFTVWAVQATIAAAATVVAAAPIYLLVAALVAVAAAVGWAYQNVGWFRDAVDAVASFITGTLWPALQTLWQMFNDKILPILKVVAEVYIKVLIAEFNAIKSVVMNVVIPALQSAWSFINDKVIPVLTAIATTIASVASTVGTKVGEIVGFITGIPGRISSAASTMWDSVTGAFTAARNYISLGVTEVVGFVTGIPGRIARGIGDGFGALWTNFKSVANRIISAWNGISFTLPSISGDWNGPLPGGNFSTPSPTFRVPQIPTFHSGIDRVPGRAGSEMLAILQAGERVIPASQNTGNGGPITLIIEGRPFSAMIADHEAAQVAQLMAGAR